MSAFKELKEEIILNIESNMPMQWIASFEEGRIINLLKEIAEEHSYRLFVWSETKKVRDIRGNDNKDYVAKKLIDKIPEICKSSTERNLFVFKDYHHEVLKAGSLSHRSLRDLAEIIRVKKQASFLFLSPTIPTLPCELENDTIVLEGPLPEVEEINGIFEPFFD